LAFLIGRELRPALRLPVAFIALSLALLIAFSRLYLGAHWFSDVAGGLAFGTAWLAILVFFYQRREEHPTGVLGLTAIASLALVLAGGWNVSRHHSLDMERYARKPMSITMTADAWLSTGWQQLPAQRIDLTGEIEEPLTIQWAGDLPSIERQLSAKGWRQPAPWLSQSALGWLTVSAAPADLPVVTRLASGRLPALTLVHDDAAAPKEARLVLRLWPTEIGLASPTQTPIWIGSVVEEQLARHLSLFTSATTSSAINANRHALVSEFPDGKLVARSDGAESPDWDGRALLLRAP